MKYLDTSSSLLLTNKTLIDKILMRLSKLELKSGINTIKSKAIKKFVTKLLPNYK